MHSDTVIRVAQIVRPAAGGIRKHVSLLAAGLDRRQFAPSVYAPADFTLDTPLPDVPQYAAAIGARTDIAADFRAINSLTRLLKGNASLAHAHGLRAALIGVLAAQRAGIPSLFTAHNLVPRMGRLQRVLLRHVGRTANGIFAVSQAVADTLTAAGLPQNKIHVVPNGIDAALFDAPADVADSAALRDGYGIPADAPLIVGVGRLSPEKGFDVLLDAFESIAPHSPRTHLLLIGEGPERVALQANAAKSDYSVRIHFAGRVENVIPLLALADIVAVPSREEGQGIVALEAMAARKPVVAAQTGGLVETVVQGVTGLLVEAGSGAALAGALSTLLLNPQLGLDMGLHGRRRVEQEYALERMLHNIENIYRSVVTK